MCSFLLVAALATLAAGAPAIEKRFASLPPKWTSLYLGNTTSEFPNIYRDGGGGGKINGINFIFFSDGIYTTGGVPKSDMSNWANFTSNSIAASGNDGKGPLSLFDFGNAQKGPLQQIPYYYNNGESDGITGIWPNNGITTLSSGAGILFPQVVNRTAISHNQDGTLYNTGVTIGVGAYGPYVSRPVQALFYKNEVQYGLFGSLAGIDGYLYMFAAITGTASSNGLKMARVPQGSWSQRSQYQYWNGSGYQAAMPAYADGGRANIFNWTQASFGTNYGPSTGELFFSSYYGVYMLIFQPADPALDNHVYMTYSASATGGWAPVQPLYTLPEPYDGFAYSFHAYPNYDSSGKTLTLSWASTSKSAGYYISMANITFA